MQTSKKLGCGAVAVITEIIKFPEYKVCIIVFACCFKHEVKVGGRCCE